MWSSPRITKVSQIKGLIFTKYCLQLKNLSSLKMSPMCIFHEVPYLNQGSHNLKTRLSIAKVTKLKKKTNKKKQKKKKQSRQ